MADLIIEGVARPWKARASIAGYTLKVNLQTKVALGDEFLAVPASGSAAGRCQAGADPAALLVDMFHF